MINPFKNDLALETSCYTSFDGKKMIFHNTDKIAPELVQFIHRQFYSMVTSKEFPCVGAKSAINLNTYRFGVYNQLASSEATLGLCYDLFQFIQEQREMESNFTTYIACFQTPTPVNESEFEKLLWEQLQMLHDEDVKYHKWDRNVSSDVFDPAFSFSFAETAFFLVGLHPGSSRFSRKFAYPTLVFNAHHQFEKLRELGKFKAFKNAIRNRDTKLQGSINPSLKDFGVDSEAKQYSGKYVDDTEWKCPFSAKQ